MKTPPVQYGDDEARRLTEEFIKTNSQPSKAARPAKKTRASK
jgi:hypothetical protein